MNENRRPLKIRDFGPLQSVAKWLSTKDISPNQISIASIVFSAISGLIFLLMPVMLPVLWVWSGLIILCFIGRGLCNILDGLVAVEGGKSTPSGELFNDIPDRISDALIFVCAGYACGMASLGWIAALLAVTTAYTRTLARGVGAPSDFQGPMAKVHRMLAISIAVFLTPVEALYTDSGFLIALSLIIISVGCVWTIWKRARAAYLYLENKDD